MSATINDMPNCIVAIVLLFWAATCFSAFIGNGRLFVTAAAALHGSVLLLVFYAVLVGHK